MGRKKAFPIITLALIVANVAIFVYLVNSPGRLGEAIQQHGFRPAAIVQGQGLHTLITSMFLHGSWMHLFGNMLALLVFGIILEMRVGPARFALIYFLADLAASMFDLVIRRDSWLPAVGASAAIAGIVGACFARFATAKAPLSYLLFLISPIIASVIILAAPSLMTVYMVYFLIVIGLPVLVLVKAPRFTAPLWPFVFIWIIAQVAFGVWTETAGIVGGTAYLAHISGFFTGMMLALLLIRGLGEEVKPREEIPTIG